MTRRILKSILIVLMLVPGLAFSATIGWLALWISAMPHSEVIVLILVAILVLSMLQIFQNCYAIWTGRKWIAWLPPHFVRPHLWPLWVQFAEVLVAYALVGAIICKLASCWHLDVCPPGFP